MTRAGWLVCLPKTRAGQRTAWKRGRAVWAEGRGRGSQPVPRCKCSPRLVRGQEKPRADFRLSFGPQPSNRCTAAGPLPRRRRPAGPRSGFPARQALPRVRAPVPFPPRLAAAPPRPAPPARSPLPAARRPRSRHSAGKPSAPRMVPALRGGGETPPRPHFRKSGVRKSRRRRASGRRDSSAGPGRAAPAESRRAAPP